MRRQRAVLLDLAVRPMSGLEYIILGLVALIAICNLLRINMLEKRLETEYRHVRAVEQRLGTTVTEREPG